MAVQVNPVTPSLPATTAIQDPAARRFAQAVADSIRTAQTPEYAIQQLSTAAAGLFSGATPPAITQWLVSSELYQQLSAAIGRVDSAAQLAVADERAARIQDIADEALARANEIVNAIAAESAARALDLANEAAARAADMAAEANARTLAVQGEADARAAGLLAEAAARGTAISNEATERQSADQGLAQSIATVTATVASNTAAIQEEQTARANADTAESNARQALATRVTSAENSITSQAAQINDRYTKAATDSAIAAATTALTAGYQAGDAGVLSSAQALVASEESARSSAIVAEASARETLASQMRGSYTGNDLSAVTTGLLYQERIARSTAVDGLAQQITLLSAGAGEQFDYQKIWYFDSGVEGWTGNGTPTVSNGWIRPADHGSDPYIVSPTGIAAPGSTYPQVRLRIRKTGSPTWAGVLWWRTAADSTWDAARSATLVEPTYDGNGIGLVTVNLVWSGTIDRIRLDLSDAQAAGSGFEVDWVAIGRPSPGASNAALLEEQLARANADSVEVSARESLSTKLTGAANPASLTLATLSAGLLFDERQARSSADATEVTARQSLSTKLAGAADPSSLTLATLSSGLLFDERQARSTADATEVTARQALSAKLTGFNDPSGKSLADLASGLIFEEKTARVSQDTALASSITTLTGRVGATESAITAEQTARANDDAAEVTARQALSTKITGTANPASLTLATLSSGLLFDERQARSTADASEVTARQALSAKITGFNDPAGKSLVDLTAGLLYEEKTARATQDTALAQSITTLTGRVGAAEAAIVSEQTARANEDIAIATSINGLSAQFGGNLTYSVLRQWEFASTVEGWVAGAATATVSNGVLTWTTTGSNPYIRFTFATADRYMGSVASKIRARVRRTAGSQAWDGNCYYITAAHGETTAYRKGIAAPTNPAAWTILEWDMSALTVGGSDYTANEIRSIRLDLVGTAGDTWQIDWISVGERVASPAALDAQENKAAITAEQTARANADGVLATSISTLRSQIGVTEGGALTTGLIQSEKTTRASNDNAIVSAVNTALAQITGVSTSISQSGENLIASWSQAQASKWSQIESEVLTAGGQTIRAALAQESNTRSTLAGQVSSTWMVRAQIDSGTGKPYIAGIALGAEGQNGGATSEFIVQADKFVMTMPGLGGYVPFAIGPTGAEFTGLTNWSNVQGATKPEDGATVGADDSNYTGSRGNNLLRNSMLKDSTAGWGYALGPGCTLGEFRTVLNENGAPKGYGALKLGFSGTASSVYESQVYCSDLAVPCVPGERMELGARVGVYRGDAQLTASFLLSDGSFMLYVPVTGGVAEATNQAAWTQNLSDLQHLWGFVAAPANAVKCYMEVRVKRTTTVAPTDLYIALPYIGKAGSAQTIYSPWNQGAFITPSEVTTWIANAAIGNAQIGGDLWSTNHVADSSGWRIYRNGNAEFRNITARGDIEASALKAGTAMVDSLNLKGTALIIPMYINAGAASWDLPYVQGTWQYKELLKFSFTLSATGTVRIDFGPYFTIKHWQGHANYPSTITKRLEILRNYSVIETVATAVSSSYITGIFIGTRWYTLSPGTHTFVVRGSALMADGGPRFDRSAAPSTVQSYTYSTSEA